MILDNKNERLKGENFMKMKKASKIMALVVAVAMVIALMPVMMVSAAVSPITISDVSISDVVGDATLSKVTVTYATDATVGAQMTLLVTEVSPTVTYDTVDTTKPINVVYIDQFDKSTSKDFVVDKAALAGKTIYIKMGGMLVDTATDPMPKVMPSGAITIPADKITESTVGAFGISDGVVITIDNTGNIVDSATKKVSVGGTDMIYSSSRNKFVGIVRGTDRTVTVTDGVSDTLIYGYVNDDTAINTLDAGAIINIYLKSVTPTDKQLLAADTNGDLQVNTLDAGSIINKYLGSIMSFSIEAQ